MRLTDILTRPLVRVPLQATDKTGAITELVGLLHEYGCVSDRDAVLRAVLEREATRSTGIGYGLAVPHGKSGACPQLAMSVGKPAKPIDFGSKDGQPVNIIVLLASPPDQTGPHIQALARISRLMLIEQFRRAVAQAGTADQLYESIRQHET